MAVLQEYKCPCCGGAIGFDSAVQKMKCPYCDTEFEMETLASYDEILKNDSDDDMNWNKAESSEWQEGEADNLRTYVCRSCGGEIVGDENMAATTCPYCNNPVVMMGQFQGKLRPDLVIPFRFDKNAAKEALRNHYKGKKFLPKVFKDENHIDEIKGIYVPFWLFDCDAEANIRYKATKVRTWSDSNYNYTKTDFYSVARGGTLAFNSVPVDASEKMDNALMESIEPFDYSQAVDFQTAYLAGYLADKYDSESDECAPRANSRIKKCTENVFANTVNGYASVLPEHSSVKLNRSLARYALLPVWILNTKWKDKQYTFAMNGQTGKFVGDLPLDKSAFKKWLFGLTGAIGAVLFALSYLIWLIA